VIEEAPAPDISEEFRSSIGNSAIEAASAVGYVGAGTVEFIVDTLTGEFFFMEMNTRLQVEHPVTEFITGVDLVEWQLLIAQGFPLPKTQEELQIRGHAVEARIYAEVPERGFLPATGTLARWRPPAGSSLTGPMRVDSGVEEGDVVGSVYDPLLAKLIVWGPNRAVALRSLKTALLKFQIAGVPTNRAFLARLAADPKFGAGGKELTTAFLEDYPHVMDEPTVTPQLAALRVAVAAVTCHLEDSRGCTEGPTSSPWQSEKNFRPNSAGGGVVALRGGSSQDSHQVRVQQAAAGRFKVSIPAAEQWGEAQDIEIEAALEGDALRWRHAEVQTCSPFATYVQQSGALSGAHIVHLFDIAADFWFVREMQGQGEAAAAASSGAPGQIVAPMPGKLVQLSVSSQQEVSEGDVLCIVEAMKMEHKVLAPCSGQVQEILTAQGDQLEEGVLLMVIAPADSPAATEA
ncbi:hypothetical protein CYMTET_13344, partial [Cymbomonas tetramitiformis]